jgi:tetratricopeptide (TPR) repeat protein
MYIDRRYRGRRRRSPWLLAILIAPVLVVGVYLLATRTAFFENPFDPFPPTPTPTRSAISFLAEAEDHYQAGRFRPALEAYERVAALEPANDEAFRQQAWIQIMLGHSKEGIELAQQAVKLDGSALNKAILAMALDWSGRYDEAIEIALEAVDQEPLLAEAHAILAEIYADKNNWERALEEAEKAVELEPNNAIALRNLGYVLDTQGRHEEALDFLGQAAELAPNLGYIHLTAGNAYLALNDFDGMIAAYEKAVEVNPDNAMALDKLGHASAIAGDPDRALATLKKAVELDPDFGLSYAHLARVYYTQLNWEAAIENFDKAFALGVENEEFFYLMGLSHQYLDDCDNALKWFEKALELNPDSAPVQQGIRRCSG